VTLHASGGNTFQPAQIDFDPNPEAKPEGGGLLKPETQRSFVTGVSHALDGLAEFDIDGFFVDFNNQPIQATSGGVAVLRPVGQQRFKAIDVEGALRPARGWMIKGSFTWSNATYVDFLTDIDGTPTQLAGNQQVLTPNHRATAGLMYSPNRGWRGSLTSTWTGRHWLDSLNTFEARDYTVVDAFFGYRFERFTLAVSGTNLTDRRDGVQLSELGEGQFIA
jgi:iron complex outermembrane receptor protein